MSDYHIKKNLRRGQSGPKSYAEIEEEVQIQQTDAKKRQLQGSKDSIFDHKGWSVKQRVKLLVFLSFYQRLPDWNSQRRSIPLYKHLSTFLKKKRTPEQCKNIHSLLKRKHETIADIIAFIQSVVEPEENFERLLQKYQNQIQSFEDNENIFEGSEAFRTDEPIIPRSKGVTQQDESYEQGREQKQLWKSRQNAANLRSKPIKQEEGAELLRQGNEPVEYSMQAFAKRRDELIQSCNFYFMEWLKCVKMMEYRSQGQGEE